MTAEQLEQGKKLSGQIEFLNNELSTLKNDIKCSKEILDEPTPGFYDNLKYLDAPNILKYHGQRIYVTSKFILKNLKNKKKLLKERIRELEGEFKKL
jgi:hypothetical protein